MFLLRDDWWLNYEIDASPGHTGTKQFRVLQIEDGVNHTLSTHQLIGVNWQKLVARRPSGFLEIVVSKNAILLSFSVSIIKWMVGCRLLRC